MTIAELQCIVSTCRACIARDEDDGDHDAPNNKKPKYQDIEAGIGNILTVKFANSSRLQFRRIRLIGPEVKIILFRKIPFKAIILDFLTIHGSFLT